jgi:hypothetical protein
MSIAVTHCPPVFNVETSMNLKPHKDDDPVMAYLGTQRNIAERRKDACKKQGASFGLLGNGPSMGKEQRGILTKTHKNDNAHCGGSRR